MGEQGTKEIARRQAPDTEVRGKSGEECEMCEEKMAMENYLGHKCLVQAFRV